MSNVNGPWYEKLLNSKILISVIILLGIFAILIYLLAFLFKSLRSGDPFPQEYSSPILAILGVIISIIALTFVSIVFSLINQANKEHALGLPQGSVRALIALCLVSSFIIIAVILFNKLTSVEVTRLEGLTKSQFDAIPIDRIVSLDIDTVILPKAVVPPLRPDYDTLISYNIQKINTISTEANDFAKQLLTILSTLAIAVSAFYFGSRATEMGGQQAVSILQNTGSGKQAAESTRDKDVTDQPGEPLNEFIALDDYKQKELIDDAIAENSSAWKKTFAPYYRYAKYGKKVKEKERRQTATNCIVFIVSEKLPLSNLESRAIPDFITFRGYRIPTDIIQDETVSHQSDAVLRPGGSISRLDSAEFGTMGLVLYRKNAKQTTFYILSCYHVLCNLELDQEMGKWKDAHQYKWKIPEDAKIDRPQVVCPCLKDDFHQALNNIVADLVAGGLDTRIDAAIAEIRPPRVGREVKNGFSFTYNGKIIRVPSGVRNLTINDNFKSEVFMWGRVSNLQKGLVKNYECKNPIPIDYKPSFTIEMEKLIEIEKISQPGDSGAPVFDANGLVIGIIVGGDKSSSGSSYVIPIDRILSRLNIDGILYYNQA